jgi:hypothetical protein
MLNMNILRKNDFENKRESHFIDDFYDIHTVIILNNIGRPKYNFIDGQKEFKTCRFCGKTQNDVTFNNKSHVIPKFLGNFLVVSNFECDECNSHFSKYETELEKYIKIPLIANTKDKDLKNRYGKNISRIDDNIIISGEKEKVEFNGLFILKILLKFGYSMLIEEEIDNYKNIKDVLLDDNTHPLIPYVFDITVRRPFDWNSIILYSKKDGIKEDYVDNILSLNFNMKKYIIFFNKDNNKYKINKDIISNKYFKLFNDIDIYNFRVRNFNNEHVIIKFNIDIFMELIKNKL